MRHAASHIGSLPAVGRLLAPGPRGGGVCRRIGRSRSAGRGPAQAAEAVHGALAQAHPGELDRRASGFREALAEGVSLGVRLLDPCLQLAPMPRKHHDVPHGDEKEGNRCQCGQVTRECFHERLPGTTTGYSAGHAGGLPR